MRYNFSIETYQDTIKSQAVEIQQLRQENKRLKRENTKLFLDTMSH